MPGAFIRNGLAAVLSGCLVCLWGLAAQAISIAEAPPATMPTQPGAPSMPTLRVTGMIEPGDADKLRAALRRIGNAWVAACRSIASLAPAISAARRAASR